MANTIKLKRGSGSDPSASDLAVGEVALRTDNGTLFTKNDAGNVTEIGASSGVSDGDKGDITVSNSGATWTVDNDAVTYAKIQNVSATDRLLGRDSSGAGIIEEISPSSVRTMLGLATSATTDTTNASNISSGTLAAGRVATLNQDTTGSAATLTTARNIGGVSFNGSANIDLPGVNSGGNQDTTGNAATATALATARTIAGASFDGSANINISYTDLTNKLSVGDGGLTQNNFTNTLKSKLDGIAASATNVTNNNQLTNGAGYITATLTEEQVEDYVGGMVTGNTETGITVTYQDSDGTLDFAVASQTDNNFTTTLKNKLDGIAASATNVTNNNQLTNGAGYITSSGTSAACSGNAATATTLATARTIGGTSFDGSANIAVALAATATTLATARTIAGVSFDGSANISLNNNAITNGAGYITATLTEEQVEDYVGGMVTGNTETGITVTYQDSDGTLDFVVASQTDNNFTTTLKNKLDGIAASATNVTNNNQLTNGAGYITSSGTSAACSGNAATATTLATARTIAGVSFDGSANISLNNNAITNGAGYITSADGGNAATLDGIDSASFLRSDAADTASGDITFGGGAGAVTIAQDSDIRFAANASGGWTGNTTDGKLNMHANYLYLSAGANGLVFREDGTDYTIMDGSGHWRPITDNAYDFGHGSYRWRSFRCVTQYFADNDSTYYGTGNDCRLYHNGTDFYVTNTAGYWKLTSTGEIHNTSPGGNYTYRQTTNTGWGIHHFNSDVGGTGAMKAYVKGDGGYHSNSDYRLKENIQALSNGWSLVKQLKPSSYTWKDDPDSSPSKNFGFIAHELQEVIPEIVTGTKDQMKKDRDGNDVPFVQTIQYDSLIPVLTSAIQEMITKIETLEIKVAALEAS